MEELRCDKHIGCESGGIEMYATTTYKSPIGMITIACDDKERIVGLWMEGQKYFGGNIAGKLEEKPSKQVFQEAKRWLERYFAGEKPAVSELPLAPIGGDFRQMVWKILREIPYGEVITYGDIAKQIAVLRKKERMSSQAVGGAVGHNPISIIIPCHRVVGANGSLTGFAGGVEKKIALLELEGADMARLFVPKQGTAL